MLEVIIWQTLTWTLLGLWSYSDPFQRSGLLWDLDWRETRWIDKSERERFKPFSSVYFIYRAWALNTPLHTFHNKYGLPASLPLMTSTTPLVSALQSLSPTHFSLKRISASALKIPHVIYSCVFVTSPDFTQTFTPGFVHLCLDRVSLSLSSCVRSKKQISKSDLIIISLSTLLSHASIKRKKTLKKKDGLNALTKYLPS